MMAKQMTARLTAMIRRRWIGYWFVVANLVAIAFFVFDMPLGSRGSMLPEWLQSLGRDVTNLGKSDWILSISAFLFFAAMATVRQAHMPKLRDRANRLKDMALYMFVTVAASGLTVNLVKRAIGRARPEHYPDLGIFSFSPFAGDASFESFPSGHATTIGAIAIALCLLVPRYRLVFLALGFWLAVTRVIVGAHYPSDVIAGFSFGAVSSVFFAFVFAKRDSVFRVAASGWPKLKRPVPLTWKTRRQD